MNGITADSDIDVLQLNLRASNVLKVGGVLTVGDLVKLRHADLLKMHNLGRKNSRLIRDALAAVGLYLKDDPEAPEESVALYADFYAKQPQKRDAIATIRDQFAMSALQGLIIASKEPEINLRHYADAAYAFADAMLEARNKPD